MAKDSTEPEPSSATNGKTGLHPVYSIPNILNKVRMLDGAKITYSAWVKLFTLHARGYKVLHHIDGTPPPIQTDPAHAEWCEIDAHVLQWIYGSISEDLLLRILETDSTAYEAWTRLKNHFTTIKGLVPQRWNKNLLTSRLSNVPLLKTIVRKSKTSAHNSTTLEAQLTIND
ncbi:hypothetical protein vseg_002001 [Gypsophila vaccaria]